MASRADAARRRPGARQRTTLTAGTSALDAGARAHFDDPAYYAHAYGDRLADVAYYLALARGSRRVLEFGVGNGRIALPLARTGIEVTGIDTSRPMLADLRKRLRGEPPAVRRRVQIVRGDMRSVRLGRRFPLVVCPFNTVLHLYLRQDVEAWLTTARAHLSPGGELVFDISLPLAADLARDPSVAYRVPPFRHPTRGRVRYREHFDYDPIRQVLLVSMFFEGGGERSMTPLTHRQFFPQEMEALIHYNGWEVRALYGDFGGGPLTPSSDVMIWHVSPRRGRLR